MTQSGSSGAYICCPKARREVCEAKKEKKNRIRVGRNTCEYAEFIPLLCVSLFSSSPSSSLWVSIYYLLMLGISSIFHISITILFLYIFLCREFPESTGTRRLTPIKEEKIYGLFTFK